MQKLQARIETLQGFYDTYADLEAQKSVIGTKEASLRDEIIKSGIDKGLNNKNTNLQTVSYLLNQAVMAEYNYRRANKT